MTRSFNPLSILEIGSVPFREGVNSCREIFEREGLPFWPQYPSRSLRENFVFQFLSSFPGLEVTPEKASFNEAKFFHQDFSKKDPLSFEPPSGWALGYSEMKDLLEEGAFLEKPVIKLQVTGPGTVWKSFFQDQVKENSAQEIQKELVRTLTAAGSAQIERVRSYDRTPLLLIDEPVPAEDLSDLKEMIAGFRKKGAWAGLHVCSSARWEGFENLGIDLFHFDSMAHSKLSAENKAFLQNFLKQKKWVAWGVVPTGRGGDFKREDLSRLFLDRLQEVSDQDLTVEEILKRSLIAPACGTGTLTPAQDDAVRNSLYLTVFRLKYQLP